MPTLSMTPDPGRSIRRSGRLAGKRVLITGTAGGQGQAGQQLFAAEGARIVGCDIQRGGAEETAAELAEQGNDVSGATVDLRDPHAARDWVEQAAARLGGIDVLYNNAAAKGGVIALTKTLTAEGAAVGIRANAISPGFVESPAADKVAVDEDQRDYIRNYMVGLHLFQRLGTGRDIAALALYLASDESSWVTGQNFRIDGGWSAGFR